jgi:hypothetical protein
MKTFRTDDERLPAWARDLREANAQLAVARKVVEVAKENFTRWLAENRDVDVRTLPAGEMICIEGVLLVEVRSQNRFDEAGFAAAQPELYAAHKRLVPTVMFKPL